MTQGAAVESRATLASVPNYSFAEAARYLRMPASTVRYWAKGGIVTRPDRPTIRFEQVLHGPPRQRLAFSDLAELLIVRELREQFNVSPQTIRRAQAYVRKTFAQPWYLYDLAVYGRDIFIEHLEPAPIATSRSGQMALAGFLDDVLQRVEIESGVPKRIFPHRESFPKGVADVAWIPVIAEQGLIVLSANTGMRLKPLEVAAIKNAGARVLYLRQTRTTTHPQLAALLMRSMRRVERFFSPGVRPRVGMLERRSHGSDPLGLAPGKIAVPSAFR